MPPGVAKDVSLDMHEQRSALAIATINSQRLTMIEIGQFAGFHIVDLATVEAELHVANGRPGELAAKRVGLAFEIVARREESRQPAGVFGQLGQERTVNVVADADAKHRGSGWPLADELQPLRLLALLGHAVRQHDHVERSIRVEILVRGVDGRAEHRSTAGSLGVEKLAGRLSVRFVGRGEHRRTAFRPRY